MNTFICEDARGLSRAAANWCQERIESRAARSIFVPAGATPVHLYKIWEEQQPAYLRGVEMLQVDDIVNGPQAGVFRRFFEEHLPSYRSQLRFIEEGDRTADVAVLGLGLNGHVAFHEPGMPNEFFSGCVKLNPVTCKNLGVSDGTWGVSYGVGSFIKSKSILIMVSGASKRDVLSQLLENDPKLPASALLRHRDLTILTDRAAMGLKPANSGPRDAVA